MRLLSTLPALVLLLGARVSDAHKHGTHDHSPNPHVHDTRELLDICANVKVNLAADLGVLDADVHLDICLCISALPLFIRANANVAAIVDVVGENAVTALLTALINDAAPKSNCKYPEHSKPFCRDKNPCAFECTDGFTPDSDANPKKCVCKGPNQVCNGKCQPKGACPSQRAHEDRRRWLGSGSCSERGRGWVPCGVYGGGPRSWECVNSARDLESCGGCMVPLTAYSPKGKDCTAIHGVADVTCHFGECVVRRCLPGLVPSADGSHCILKHPKSMEGYSSEEVYDPEYEQARVYGLEHVPLDRQ